MGVESPGVILHVSMTDGKCFQGKSAQVAAKYSMCKCTWQTQKKIPRPPAWELPYSVPLQAHDISLYFDNVSWQAQVSQFDQHRVHLSPTGSWLQTTTGCQSWFPSSTPSPGDTRKYIKVYVIYNRFLFLYSLPETWFKQVQDLDIHTLLFSTESEALVPVPLVSFLVIT